MKYRTWTAFPVIKRYFYSNLHFILFSYHIPSDLLSIVFSAGIKHGQVYEWDALMDRFKKAKSLQEQSLILSSLVATSDKKLLER